MQLPLRRAMTNQIAFCFTNGQLDLLRDIVIHDVYRATNSSESPMWVSTRTSRFICRPDLYGADRGNTTAGLCRGIYGLYCTEIYEGRFCGL
jgi:hypothetical protein